MTKCRTGWLAACIAVLLVGVGTALHASPRTSPVAVVLVGVASFGLLGLVLAGSPSALRAFCRWLRSIATPSASQVDALARVFANAGIGYVGVLPEPDPRELTDDEMCQRWRAGCVYLRRPPSAAAAMRAVEQRQIYLDEFERRYPGAFAAWLASGAGTLDYLTPYAMRGGDDRAGINWDELTRGHD